MGPHQPIKIKDKDKSQQNCRGLLYKHFCKNRIQISAIGPEKIVNFHFSRFKSIETLSYHSNQISYPTEIKKHKLCRDYCQEHVYKVQASCRRQFP